MQKLDFSAKLSIPVMLVLTMASVSCGSRSVDLGAAGGGEPDNVTVASIATDESGTSMKLFQLDDQDVEAPPIMEMGSWEFDCGGMKFATNQGSVPTSPEGSTLFPKECRRKTNLGTDNAVQCLYQPLLGLSNGTLSVNSLENNDVSVVLSYGTNSDENYPLSLTESFDEKISEGISAKMGFMMEPDSSTPEAAANSDPQGYYHDTAAPLSQPDWMGKKLPPNRKLSELSLPGTHDTMATDPNMKCGPIAKTQSMDLEEQLESGIRAFDIRLKCNAVGFNFDDGAMTAFHGICTMDRNLDEILTTMEKFLKRNPTEALFVQVKNENYNTNTCQNGALFWDVFGAYYNRYKNIIWEPTGTKDPTFQEIKGKILVMQNIDGAPYDSNSEAKYGLKYPGIFYGHVQDDFHLFDNWSLYNKWIGENDVRFVPFAKPHWHKTLVFGGVKRYLLFAKAGGRGYMNYLSGSVGSFPYFVAGGGSSPQTNAPRLWTGIAGSKKNKDGKYPDFEHRYYGTQKTPQVSIWFVGMNDLTAQWLKNQQPTYTGIIYSDFPGKDLISEIISANDRFIPLQDQCFGLPDFTPCYLPDAAYKNNFCKDGICVKPSSCDHTRISSGPYFQLPPASGSHFKKDVSFPHQPVVTDTVTGLLWQGCVAGRSGDMCRSGDFEYRNQKEALDYCDKLEWGGKKPWRLPDRYELMSIVDYGRTKPAIDISKFPNTPYLEKKWNEYMISSSCNSYNDGAWIVGLNYGDVTYSDYPNDTRHAVRCVYGEKPDIGKRFSRTFLLNEQPVVYDSVTKLYWQGCTFGLTGTNCENGSRDFLDWNGAVVYCNSLDWGGLKGWRLPDIQELASIVDNRYSPATDPAAFPPYSSTLWSSTYDRSTTYYHLPYYVDFYLGNLGCFGVDERISARCVHSEQSSQ